MALMIIIVILLALFALAFLTKRRFGILGLGLAAGALLATQLTRSVSLLLDQNDIPVAPLTSLAVASMLLTLLPALVLLISGPKYSQRSHAIFGSLAFALMGTLLLLGPLTTSLPIELSLRGFFNEIAKYQSSILAVAISLAVVDVWLTHTLHPSHKKKKE